MKGHSEGRIHESSGGMRRMRINGRLVICQLATWCAAHGYAQGTSANSSVVVTVTGTVKSGTNGNPNTKPPGAGMVFGGATNLAGEPFTLTLNFDPSQGTSVY